ncbi:MAG: hypothetical protein LUH57_00200 [Ruminococcus sp.]|nr:hypothetical protein [Ruminococcus sp.]
MKNSDNRNKMGSAELCYRLFIIFISALFLLLLLASLIVAKAVVGNEENVKTSCGVLSSIFFALVIMTLATLIVCWVAMKKTGAANLMVSTLLMTVSSVFLLLNCKWVYTVYAYSAGNDEFVLSQIGDTVESYYDFLDSVHLRWLLLGFALAFIVILGAVSFFHLKRYRQEIREEI